MLLVSALPARAQKSEFFGIAFGVLLVALFALIGVLSITMVSYWRWTGKYPYYFLFRKSPNKGHRLQTETGERGEKDC